MKKVQKYNKLFTKLYKMTKKSIFYFFEDIKTISFDYNVSSLRLHAPGLFEEKHIRLAEMAALADQAELPKKSKLDFSLFNTQGCWRTFSFYQIRPKSR